MNAPPLPPNIVAVHPERMLTVTLQYPGYVVQVNAISCRYIPATVQVMQQVIQQQQRVVAIEVIRDPMNQIPMQPYQVPANLLEVIVLPANALLQVRPYIV
jgi:hypothetical protein